MPRFSGFRAVRYAAEPYDTDPYELLIAPPYDVLSEAQAAGYRERHPHNITHLDLPVGPDRYTRAGELYRRWLADGVLVADEVPTLTIYRLRFRDATGSLRSIAGVVGGLEVVDEGTAPDSKGGVLPHERTTPKASTDRLDLTRATQANLSPVWGLSLSSGLTELLVEPAEPIAAVHDHDEFPDGVEHVIERITDPERIAAIAAIIAADDVLIADGHHRYGVARTYRDEVRSRTGRRDTAAEATLAFVSELVEDQLSVAAIHRLYRGVDLDQLRTALARCFELVPIGRPDQDTLSRMEADGFLTLITPDGAYALTPRPGAFDGMRRLDGLWLEHTFADVDAEVSYQHGVDEVLSAVESGAAAAGILIRPVSVAEIERTAREGLLMPPKSTFFTPKLKTGFVIRDLTD
ncbi:DUF1015 domain-containing protein [Microlunatus elymi]|uniref:DUF1015 domain-containing protein n=1 Tax=Microlunatus elymi TaxID=2596828 RepID=A0A516Q0L8_9ACTN|nr:DUF1015 domain-containing protein [Microlunatus elymi]QDP96986.1 DUF1015 domain-containing protein [Microlunatus elymi]